MCSSTTFSSSRRRLHLAKPSGTGESVSAISFAPAAPSKIRRRAEFELYLRANTASNPSSTSWRLVRSTVAMLVSSAAAIRAAERWRSIKLSEFERRQITAVRKELDQEYEAQVGPKTQLSKDA